ncbi:unnamed protein product [Rodentolepis nana]|uniref:Uncharacterized protein n=1 Tax=Rodentolepis nana TaxID=102285 RepID=A0A0R3TBH9_RODNA|nr:unnamed protein product [Rodentolepis nana]
MAMEQRSCKVRYGNAPSDLLQTGLPQGAVTSCIQAFHRELSQAALFFPQGAVTTCTLFNVDRELSQAALFSMSSSMDSYGRQVLTLCR